MSLALAVIAITITCNETAEQDAMAAMVGFASRNLGKKVGDGQCADLPAEGLTSTNAKPFGTWPDYPDEGDYVWGRRTATLTAESHTSQLKPGEVLQFRDVVIVTKAGNAKFTFRAVHHTAVVESYEPGSGLVKILEQNSQGRAYVTRGIIDLNGLQTGTIWVYRPQPKSASGR